MSLYYGILFVFRKSFYILGLLSVSFNLPYMFKINIYLSIKNKSDKQTEILSPWVKSCKWLIVKADF